MVSAFRLRNLTGSETATLVNAEDLVHSDVSSDDEQGAHNISDQGGDNDADGSIVSTVHICHKT
jgi:hypothetical protein